MNDDDFKRDRDAAAELEFKKADGSVGYCVECFKDGADWAHERASAEIEASKDFAVREVARMQNIFLGEQSAVLEVMRNKNADLREQLEAARAELKAKHLECEKLKNARDDRTEALFRERRVCAENDKLRVDLAIAVEALEFYSSMGNDDDTKIDKCLERALNDRGSDHITVNMGGKFIAEKAREALAKIDGGTE